jgi:hypothetical protein
MCDNRRNAVVVALVDVAARSKQQLEAVGVAVRGGNANRRSAVVVALVDVAARYDTISFIGRNGVSRKTTQLHATLYLVLGFRHKLSNVRKHESNITDRVRKWSDASGACVLWIRTTSKG